MRKHRIIEPVEQKAYSTDLEFICPFCPTILTTRKVSVIRDENGRPGVMHEEPACAKFIELEPDEFVAQARMRFEDDIKRGIGKRKS